MLGECDSSGNLTATRSYDVYGAVRTSAGTSTSKHKCVGSLGHPSEDESGLIYMPARYMDAERTMAMVGILVLHVEVTQTDYSWLLVYVTATLFTLLTASVVGIVVGIKPIIVVCDGLAVIVFGACILFEVSSLSREEATVSPVTAAADLYVSVLCLYLSLLDLATQSFRNK